MLSSGLTLRVLPGCAPQRVERVVVEPLGDFAGATGELVSAALRDEPVRLKQLPPAAQWFRLEIDADGFRGAALGRASDMGEQHEALILPLGRSCAVLDETLPVAPERARALLRGTDLLIAGGARDRANATQEAWLLRVAEPGLTPLDDSQKLAVARTGAVAVNMGGEVWVLGGVSNLGQGSAALDSYERFDVAAGGFTGAIGRMRTGRYGHAALALPDGSVLVAGGRASVGGEPLTSIESIAADGKTSSVWKGNDAELPFSAAQLTLQLRDDGRVIAFGEDVDGGAHFALLDPRLRQLLPLAAPGQSETQRMAAGVALPGGRFAVLELECAAPECERDAAALVTTGRMQLLFEGEAGFQTLTDWLGSFEGLSRPRALALSDGRILLAGVRNGEPAMRILNPGNRDVASRSLDIVVDDIFMREDGSVLLLGADGARVLREDALSAFDNPGGTLTADDSEVLCLDAYGRFAREGLGLRASVAGARFDLAKLRYQAVRITLQVEGKAQLLLRPELGDARLIDLGGEKFGPAFCQLSVTPGQPLELERRAERVTLRAGAKQRSCQLEGIAGSIAIGLSAVESQTLVRELRVERL